MTFRASHAGKVGGRTLALAALAAIAVAGCGEDEGSEETAATADAQQIALTATGDGLEVPETAEAGLAEISLENTDQRPHDAQLIRVEGDQSADETAEVIAGAPRGEPFPDWFFAGGGVGTTPPDETRTVTQTLEPGTYYAFDTERGGPPTDPPAIEVTGEATDEAVSTDAPATITASEYAFETEGLSSDATEVTFENAGEQPHHIVAAPLEQGATIEDVEEFAREESGPPPVNLQETISTAVVEGGDTQVVDLEFDSGRYALLCFISDREGGPPHVAQGMIAEAEVE